jgi:pyruvate kinase
MSSNKTLTRSREDNSLPEDNNLEHLCRLNITEPTDEARKTGIICTTGPASRSVEMLSELIANGMNIARLDFSHASHEYHAETIRNIRQAIREAKNSPVVAIAIDTKGPEIRTGRLLGGANAQFMLKKDEKICLTTNAAFANYGSAEKLYVDFERLPKFLTVGQKIYLDYGMILLIVDEILDEEIICTVKNGGLLGNKKRVNLPGIRVDLPFVTEKDKTDLQFAIEQDVDVISASLVRTPQDVQDIRDALGEKGKHIRIVAKIEKQQGVENADEIIAAADGIMVARGDLGIEIPIQKVFLVQQMFIAKCNRAGKSVTCATQMLESMISKPRPTRAEGSDVANAVLDGADCLMLSGETATGAYPVESLQIMHDICKEAEKAFFQSKFVEDIRKNTPKPTNYAHTIAYAATLSAMYSRASAIVLLTASGVTAALCARYKPPAPIIAVIRDERLARQLHLYRGLFPVVYDQSECDTEWTVDVDKQIEAGIAFGKERSFINSGDFVVVISGWREGDDNTNTVMIQRTK